MVIISSVCYQRNRQFFVLLEINNQKNIYSVKHCFNEYGVYFTDFHRQMLKQKRTSECDRIEMTQKLDQILLLINIFFIKLRSNPK